MIQENSIHPKKLMTLRTFTPDDQLAFAKLSGDCNPVHLDPVLARRLVFGRQIVHGLHALLWSFDHYLKSRRQPLELQTVKVNFQSAIGVGQSVDSIYHSPHENRLEIQMHVDGAPVVWAQIAWKNLSQLPPGHLPTTSDKPQKCRERSLDDALEAAGNLSLYFDAEMASRLFPNLTQMLSALQFGALLSTTRLVGMECPGLHSIFAGLNLNFVPEIAAGPRLSYRVSDCNKPLALCAMDVEAPGMRGQIKSFVRPKPQSQSAFIDVCGEVESGEFSAQRALIIGGSRGLGEVTAKLLAAGGAEVLITYHQGQQDAQRVVEELVSHGAAADCQLWNVLQPPPAMADMVTNRSRPLYLYYFATPFIFGAAKGRFSAQRFTTFSEYYITGFLRTVQILMATAIGLEKILYPSSTAIEELPVDMAEYAAAKMAGEILCDFLQKTHPGLVIHMPRLPRLATDQTVSLLPVKNQDPLLILLENLRYLRQK